MTERKHVEGDTVQIKSREWWEKNRDEQGDIRFGYCTEPFVGTMAQYCGKAARIVNDEAGDYELDIDNGFWTWNDNMFES